MKLRLLYTLLIVLTIVSCAHPGLTRKQEQTISPEAQQFIKTHKPRRLPFIQFPEKAVIKSRLKQNAELQPLLEQHRSAFNISVRRDTMDGVPVVVLLPPGTSLETTAAIGFYIHGGAFMFGSAYDFMALAMTHELGIPVISVDYSFSPTVQFPVALNESFAVYKKTAELYAAKKIVAFGVSAGGNLLLSTLLQARDSNLKLPVATGLFTPFTDATGSGDSYRSNEGRDPVLAWKNQVDKVVIAYAGDRDLRNPQISPAYADYTKGFPPSIITTGTRDLLLSDCTRLYQQLKDAQAIVELSVYEGMWHAFNSSPEIPEAAQCRKEVALFLKAYLAE